MSARWKMLALDPPLSRQNSPQSHPQKPSEFICLLGGRCWLYTPRLLEKKSAQSPPQKPCQSKKSTKKQKEGAPKHNRRKEKPPAKKWPPHNGTGDKRKNKARRTHRIEEAKIKHHAKKWPFQNDTSDKPAKKRRTSREGVATQNDTGERSQDTGKVHCRKARRAVCIRVIPEGEVAPASCTC